MAEPTIKTAEPQPQLAPVPRGVALRPGFDPATALGLACGIALITAAIVAGGSARSFVNLPSILIVVGGTFSAVTMCFSVADVVRSIGVAGGALAGSVRQPADAATTMLRLAEAARRQGVLALQRVLPEMDDAGLLHKGLSCLVDGIPVVELRAILERELHAHAQRLGIAARVLRRAAEFAPAMGLIGTLIGLVQMLGRLDDPSAIGPSMAVALLTTLYGAVLANLVFAPLAAKLERNAATDTLIAQIQFAGIVSMALHENPRRLEIVLNSMLPPADRVRYFD